MSGTQAAITAAQLVAVQFQSWQPWVPPPENPPGPPDFRYGIQSSSFSRTWMDVVRASWEPVPPNPTLPSLDALNIGAGAALTIQGNTRVLWQAAILSTWVPPDPLPTIPTQLGKVVTKAGPPVPAPPTPGNKVTPPQHVNAFGAVPMYSVPAVGASGLVGGIVPAAGLASTIVQGGVAIAVAIGPLNGGWILNPTNSAAQGIVTAENCYVDLVNEPGSTDALANNTTSLITPGQTFTIPAIAAGVIVYVNAATSGHKLTINVW